MGKVYDALRRAEAQRDQRRTEAVSPAGAALGAPPIGRARALRRRPRPSFGRIRSWFRRAPAPVAEEAAALNKRRIALVQPDSFVAEQFRSLRARLDALASERPIRTIAVTSAIPGEGKTMAAVNLAIVDSMSVGRRVLLVDCDLRKPKVQAALNLQPEAGLAEVLTDQAPLDRAVIKVEGTNLEVLPVRTTPPNPSELLASGRMRSLVEELTRNYDQVIIDTPPTLALPDAKIVSELADGLILVVRADFTPSEHVEAALDVLDRRRVIGLLLNGAEADLERYGY